MIDENTTKKIAPIWVLFFFIKHIMLHFIPRFGITGHNITHFNTYYVTLHYDKKQWEESYYNNFNTYYVTLHFDGRNFPTSESISISIHIMLHFIPRKYKIPLLRDIYILAHKSAFFNTFYQPFFIFFST